MSTEITKWADEAMYEAQPMGSGVYLLSATSDPLGAMACAMRMYRGDPVTDILNISDEDRRWAWEESIKGHLKAPWEFVDFQFMIEGVTRAFTHQMVRQRTAVFAQESLRFAVKRGFASEAQLPPSILPGPAANEPTFKIWSDAMHRIEWAYNALIDAGIPAEDARGLLPHCVSTRLIYKTNLRGLLEHAGNRLCTQAQFEWRKVFVGIMTAIRDHSSRYAVRLGTGQIQFGLADWQWQLISSARPETFAPVCYKLGRCPFKSDIDRGCVIRERVDRGAFDEIKTEEWLNNPTAGLTVSEWGQERPS